MRSYLVFSRRSLVFFLLACGICAALGWGVIWTEFTWFALQQQHLSLAKDNAQKALLVAQPVSVLTLHSIPDIEVWQAGLKEIVLAAKLQQLTVPFLQQLVSPATSVSTADLNAAVKKLNSNTQYLEKKLAMSLVSKKLFKLPIGALTNDLEQVVATLTTGQQNILVLLQNSQELRATGGFMGSYALLHLQDGQMQNLEIQDIYEPDGQFTGFVEAPLGLKEYLSSGHGLRLPDANWWPDFPTSAEQILNFFALGKKTEINQVIAINLAVAQDLLKIVGDVYLPDYQLTVAADNLPTVARSDRTQFFPGSQQKRNFLAALFTALKLKLVDLAPNQQLAVIKLIGQKLQNKEIQIYAADTNLENIWQKYNFAGAVKKNLPSQFLLFPVEANVGINKANKKISRAFSLIKSQQIVTLTMQIKNENDPQELEPPVPPLKTGRPLDYVNYQRLLLPNSVTVKEILLDGQPLNRWDESLDKQNLKEVGFLINVPVQKSAIITVTLELPAEMAANQSLVLQKQSGVPPILYHVEWNGQISDLLLEKDQIIDY